MKKIAFILIAVTFCKVSFSQSYTINGMVKDNKTNNPIIGAAVFELGDATIGTATDTEGFFSLSFEKTHILLKIAYIGYKDTVFDMHLKNDTALIINLISETAIDEVEIEEDSLNWKPQIDTLSGDYKIVQAENFVKKDEIKAKEIINPVIKKIKKPNINDIYIPGNNEIFGKTIYIDEARLYFPKQFIKIIPFINPSTVGDYTYYDTEFPAEYGGHLAPVTSFKVKEGNMTDYSGKIDFNFFRTGVSIQGPIKEDLSSFFVSVRKSYLNNFYTNLFRKDHSADEIFWSQPAFWDLNLKYTHRLSEKNQFSAGFFQNYNRLKSGVNIEIEDTVASGIKREINSSFGNSVLNLNFKHKFSENLNFNSAIVFSNFSSKNTFTGDSTQAGSYINRYDAAYTSTNNEAALKFKASYNLDNEHHLLFGANVGNNHFKTVNANLSLNDFEHPDNIDTTWESNAVNAQEYALFVQDKLIVNDELSFNGGLRFSAFVNSGTTYFSIEPRFFANYQLFKFLSLNLTYDYHKEFTHMLFGDFAGISSGIFIPSSENTLPQITNHFAASAKINLPYDIKLRGNIFYDNISNLYEYKNDYNFFDYPDKTVLTGMNIEDRITPAKGNYSGIRIILSKKYKNLSINIGQTISDFSVKSDSINFGQSYQYRNNHRNEFSLKLSYNINENLYVFANWIYQSGNFVSLQKQHYIPYDYTDGALGTKTVIKPTYLTDNTELSLLNRNDFQLPAYHRMDIGASYILDNHTFGIHIYNVYNHKNPDLIDYKRSVLTNSTANQLVKYTNLPFFPTLSYSYRFEY